MPNSVGPSSLPPRRLPSDSIRLRFPGLARFMTVDDLLRYLGEDLGADLDTKSQIYSDLVLCVQTGGLVGRLAQTVLWLGLWPGLTAAVTRRAWFWRDVPADLVSEVSAAFTRLIARMDSDAGPARGRHPCAQHGARRHQGQRPSPAAPLP